MTDFVRDADDSEIAERIARLLETALTGVRDSRGETAIAVPGGSTPFPIFEKLVTLDLDFARLAVWPTDDRVVSEDHTASNTGRMRAVFEPVGARVVALSENAMPPRFALTWLGMGADGHIASLFPNTDPDPRDPHAVRRLTPDPLPPEAPFDRITLTMPALLYSDALIFVIRGEDKRAVFEAADAGKSDLPVARLLREAERRGVPITCFT